MATASDREIMDATLHILEEAGVRLDIETIEIGEKIYLSGNAAGIAPESWKSLRRTKVFLKVPITNPQDGGYRIDTLYRGFGRDAAWHR